MLADVTKLPDDQREALVLAEVGDLSHSDISAILGCEVTKVKSLVFQARTALIDRRIARETSCAEIREQLATLRGGALRRSTLRHHLEACPGCSEYREEIRRQRAMLALALPVVPSAALKAKVFGGIGFGLGGSAAAGGGAVATTASSIGSAASGGLAAKLGIVAVLAVGGASGATVANNGHIPLLHDTPASAPAHESSSSNPGGSSGTSAAHSGTTAAGTAAATAGDSGTHKVEGSRRSASGTEHGFTPVTGESNGERARAFAQTRGKGKEISATHRHATAHKRAHPLKRVHTKHVAKPKKVTPVAPVHTQPVPKSQETTTTTTPEPTTTTPTATTTTPTTTEQHTEQAPSHGNTNGARTTG
jgi:hypothetical protein